MFYIHTNNIYLIFVLIFIKINLLSLSEQLLPLLILENASLLSIDSFVSYKNFPLIVWYY